MQAMTDVPAPGFLKLSAECLAICAMDQESVTREYRAPIALKRKKPNRSRLGFLLLRVLAPRPGLEPGTCGLTVRRSTN